MLRPATVIIAVAALAASCGRVEEPRPSAVSEPSVAPAASSAGGAQAAPRPSATPAASATPSAAPPSRTAAPCQHPMPAVSPPRAPPAAHCPPDPDGRPTMPKGTLRFVQARNAPELEVELASTPAHREHGLMYRTDMKENQGMLFSWPVERPRTFWMRNTCVPLDMLFLSYDGMVVGVLEQVPVMNDDPRTVPCAAAHVLEVNAGWVRRYGVKVGHVATIVR